MSLRCAAMCCAALGCAVLCCKVLGSTWPIKCSLEPAGVHLFLNSLSCRRGSRLHLLQVVQQLPDAHDNQVVRGALQGLQLGTVPYMARHFMAHHQPCCCCPPAGQSKRSLTDLWGLMNSKQSLHCKACCLAPCKGDRPCHWLGRHPFYCCRLRRQ